MGTEPVDLNVIVRALLRGRIDKRWGGSVKAAAEGMGVPQRTLARFISGGGGKLSMLSGVIDGLKTDPFIFLIEHEAFAALRPTWERSYSTAHYERLARILPPEELAGVVKMIEMGKRLDIHDEVVAVVAKMIETTRHARGRQTTMRRSHRRATKTQRKTT